MNSQRIGLRVAAAIFAIFAVCHVVRLYKHATVLVANHEIPLGASWVALIIAAILCIWMWRLASASR
jgi:hypothetical protein